MKAPVKGKPARTGKNSAARPAAAKKTKALPKAKASAKAAPGKTVKAPPGGGLAFDEFEALRRQLDVSLDDLSARLGLTRAEIAQRKASGRLTTDESGKVVSYARLLGRAVRLFGNLDKARQWLKAPQRGLHGAVPLDYAQTDLGAREVEKLLRELRLGA